MPAIHRYKADNMIRARGDGRDDGFKIFHSEVMESGALPSHTLNCVKNVIDKALRCFATVFFTFETYRNPMKFPCFNVISVVLGNLLVKSYLVNNHSGGIFFETPLSIYSALKQTYISVFKSSSLASSLARIAEDNP